MSCGPEIGLKQQSQPLAVIDDAAPANAVVDLL
jgi:hypothetical protein